MAKFFDSNKFLFVETHNGFLSPVHFRDLGQKTNELYNGASWCDVIINNVPLDTTIQFEEEISYINNSVDSSPKRVSMINERKIDTVIPMEYSGFQNKWVNRIDKIINGPITLQEVKKKKKGVERYPVKPKKSAKIDRDQYSSDTFMELVDTKNQGILQDHIYRIYNHEQRSRQTYIPPEHWLFPIIEWKKIWIEIDRIYNGYIRDYIYISEGEESPHSPHIEGPAILFFNKNNEIDYWSTSVLDFATLSLSSRLSRAENEFMMNPSDDSFERYHDVWKLTQPGYWLNSSFGWSFNGCNIDANVPMPHL